MQQVYLVKDGLCSAAIHIYSTYSMPVGGKAVERYLHICSIHEDGVLDLFGEEVANLVDESGHAWVNVSASLVEE